MPQAFIALSDGKPIGMISLIAEDHPDFLHLHPWLASGYVEPAVRGSKAFYLLNRAAIMFVRDRMKEKFLYVYTHLKAAGKGWAFMQETYDPFNPAEKVGLYRYDVCQSMDLTKGK